MVKLIRYLSVQAEIIKSDSPDPIPSNLTLHPRLRPNYYLAGMKANTPDNIDELYESLPENERLIASILRDLILENLPGCREKKSYGAPFYFGKKAICYVWPASITWGSKVQGKGVKLGFNQGRKLDHKGYLNFGKRKSIGSRIYLEPEGIDVEIVQQLLRAAWILDQV